MEENRYYYIVQDKNTKETFSLTLGFSRLFSPGVFTSLRTIIGVPRARKDMIKNRNLELIYIEVTKKDDLNYELICELDELMSSRNKSLLTINQLQ